MTFFWYNLDSREIQKGFEMITEVGGFFVKMLLQMVIWVFVLSIKIDDKLIFDHAHNFLVKNEVVAALEKQFSDLWEDVIKTAKNGVQNAPNKDADLL